jgi:DnaK suppressor protein
VKEAQLQKLKALLLALREELSEQGREKIAPNRTSAAEIGGDEDEQPLNEMHQAIASNRNRTHSGMLGRVERALKKLADAPEDVGVCEECGEDIPFGRLTAMPYAELCVTCQSGRDAPKGGPTRKKITDYQ